MLKWKKQNRPGVPTYTSGPYTIEKFEGRWTAYCNCPGGLLEQFPSRRLSPISDSENFKTLREAKARCQYHSDPCFGSMLALVCSH